MKHFVCYIILCDFAIVCYQSCEIDIDEHISHKYYFAIYNC